MKKRLFWVFAVIILTLFSCDELPENGDTVNKSGLKTAIDAANVAKNGVVISSNGNDVLITVYWVTQEQMDIFITEIASAQTIFDNENADQDMVDDAKTVIETATTTFNGQKQFGSKTENNNELDFMISILGNTFNLSDFSQTYWTFQEGGNKNNISGQTGGDYFYNGTDVYFFGHYEGKACYWKNGIKIDLSAGLPEIDTSYGTTSFADAIAIVNEDIYFAGYYWYYDYEDEVRYTTVCYWKNGTRIDIETREGLGGLNVGQIIVSGNDIFINGSYWLSGIDIMINCYWKNNQRIDSSDEDIYSLFGVSGSDVYFSGENNQGIYYIKNNIKHILPNSLNAQLNNMLISNNDVYIIGSYDTGSDFRACYWKNGIKIDLLGGTGDSNARDIVIIDNNIFIAGEINSSWNDLTFTTTSTFCYWINGEVKILLENQINSSILALSVNKK